MQCKQTIYFKTGGDIALLETDELLLPGETFHISVDVLINGELSLSAAKEIWHCGNNAIQDKKQEVYCVQR